MSFFMSNARRNPKEEARYKKEVMTGELTGWLDYIVGVGVGQSELYMTGGWVVLR